MTFLHSMPRTALLAATAVALLGLGSAQGASATSGAVATVLQPQITAYSEWGLGAAMAHDPDTQQLVLTGGVAFPAVCGCDGTGGTWVWSGSDFVSVTPPGGGSVQGHVVYDAATHQLLRIGGLKADFSTPATDQFAEWTGTTWTPLHPVHQPPARAVDSVAYDARTRQLILFGGFTAAGRLADTWSWTGTDWLELHPATSPPARGQAQFSYDDATGQLVLFGGSGTAAGGGVELLADTWLWTGKTWQQKFPLSNPGPLSGGAAGYDAALHQLLIYGGVQQIGTPNTTSRALWAWTGSNWQLAPSAVGPSNVNLPSMAFEPKTGRMVLLAPDRDKTLGLLHTLLLVAAPATTSIVATPEVAAAGTPIALTASVQAGAIAVPTGSVTFVDGSTPIFGCTAIALPGPAACTFTPTVGVHRVRAIYNPVPGFLAGKTRTTTVTIS